MGLPNQGDTRGDIALAVAHCYPATILDNTRVPFLLTLSVGNRHTQFLRQQTRLNALEDVQRAVDLPGMSYGCGFHPGRLINADRPLDHCQCSHHSFQYGRKLSKVTTELLQRFTPR